MGKVSKANTPARSKGIFQKNNLGKNTLFTILGGMVLMFVYFIIHAHYSSLNSKREQVFSQLLSVVNTATLHIDVNKLNKLDSLYPEKDDITNNNQSRIYHELHEYLYHVQHDNGLNTPVYLVKYNEEDSIFNFLVTSAEVPYYKHDFKQFPAKLVEQLDSGGVLNDYHSENGRWLSAFSPVLDGDGNAVAILMADMQFNDYINDANKILIKNIVISLLGVLVVGLLMWYFIKKVVKKEEKYQTLLLQKHDEILNQKEEIETQNQYIVDNNQKLEVAKKKLEESNQKLNELNNNLEAVVKQRTQLLEATNNELNTLLYRSSHDLLGPVASIKGLMGLIEKELPLKGGNEYYKKLDHIIARIEGLIRSISRVHEIKTKKLDSQKFNFKQLVETNYHVIRKSHLKGNIRFHNEVDDSINIETDEELMEFVISELLKNSFGYLSIAHQKVDKYLKFSSTIKDDAFEFDAIDNSGGIKDEVASQIFYMFYRGHEHSEGPGLGLYIVKQALDRLGGKIYLVDTHDDKTHFKIIIPFNPSFKVHYADNSLKKIN